MQQIPHSLRLTASVLACAMLASCADPVPFEPAELASPSGPASQKATKDHVEFPFDIDAYLQFSCLDEPAHFVVSAMYVLDFVTTSSGMSNLRGLFVVDRSVSYVEYKGVTYTVATGRPGHDDVWHSVTDLNGQLYVEAGVEPDFLSSETGERLRLNFTWQFVIDANGVVRRDFQVKGACPIVP
jgi:hypothetical protein